MSHPTIKIACVVAGFAVAALAATSAQAAKPLSVQQKNQMAEAMARNYAAKSKSKAPPKTAAQARSTLMKEGGGAESIEVPEDVYNYLTASPDAHGNMQVHDTDSAGTPVSKSAEVADEK